VTIDRLDDQELCRLAGTGDAEAFAELYRRYVGGILRQLMWAGCPVDWAEDGAHEVFLKVWGALERGQRPERFHLWVRQIAHRVLIDYWRQQKHAREVLTEPPEMAAPTRDPDAPLLVRHLLDHLDGSLREIVVLHFYEDLTLDDIASVLEIPLGTVKSRLARAYTRLATVAGGVEHQPAPVDAARTAPAAKRSGRSVRKKQVGRAAWAGGSDRHD
jgi:RNA polymerase sigma-70 factor (ECF subfamily)